MDEFLTLYEAAELMRMTSTKLSALAKAGIVPVYRFADVGKILFKRDELLTLVRPAKSREVSMRRGRSAPAAGDNGDKNRKGGVT